MTRYEVSEHVYVCGQCEQMQGDEEVSSEIAVCSPDQYVLYFSGE